MILHTGTTAPSGNSGARTLDLAEVLEHVRREQAEAQRYAPRHRNDEPHPALLALIAVGGLLSCTAFWGAIVLLAVWIIL